ERSLQAAHAILAGLGADVAMMAVGKWGEEHRLRERERVLLRASENKYRTLVEHSAEGIFLADAEFNFLEVNPKASALTGYARDELVSMNVRQLLLPEDSSRALPQAYQEGVGYRETSVVRKDGTVFLGQVAVTVFELESQKVAMGLLRDITEERRLQDEAQSQQRELANTLNKYRALVEHNTEAIFLTDAKGHFLEVNPRACELSGYSRGELLEMRSVQLLQPNAAPRTLARIVARGFGRREFVCVRKDGTEFLGALTFSSLDLEGQTVVLATVRDITEERRLQDDVQAQQRELANSEQVNRAVVQHASDAIFLADTEGNFLEVNLKACQLTGYSREELLGMRTTQFLRLDDSHRTLAQIVAEGAAPRELVLVRKDGSEFLAALDFTVFEMDGQQVVLGIARDVTEERRLQAEILAGKQALEEGYHLHLHSLGLALAARNPYTGGHGQRVRDYAMAVGRRLGLPEERISVMGIAAELHDYGKIGLSDAILLKPGPLTPPEWAEIRRHPELSVSLVEHIPFLQEAIPIIRAHHEKLDGSGYPDGLRGEGIPIEARIIGVVDAYDALTTERSYRSAFSHEEALAILQGESGSKWDPQVMQAFFQAMDDWVAPRTEEPAGAPGGV
ncbi:MAG TPA: PAS domain S-box protein, partial [Dehalococcoidia bacterium]|nr:PAS domain S-box protein [Dehalococcoidia bacterium]